MTSIPLRVGQPINFIDELTGELTTLYITSMSRVREHCDPVYVTEITAKLKDKPKSASSSHENRLKELEEWKQKEDAYTSRQFDGHLGRIKALEQWQRNHDFWPKNHDDSGCVYKKEVYTGWDEWSKSK